MLVFFSVLQLKFGKLLQFLIGVHREEKCLLKILAFCLKSDTSSPSTRRAGTIRIFLLLKNLFMIDQYVLGAVLGLSKFVLILAISVF